MANQPGFAGFTRAAIEFFRELEKNNTREWFQPRKELFEQTVRGPMLELVDEVNRALAGFAPGHVTDPKKALFRIYRDTRFSPDKTPYKNHIAASFGHRGMEKLGGAGYYFSVNHKAIEIAGGIYHPSPEVMLAVRQHISRTQDEFETILANRTLRKRVGELQGAELTRAPKGFDPAHPAAHLLRKKDWVFFVELDPKVALTRKLTSEIISRFEALAPAIEYLNRPLVKKSRSRGKGILF